MTLELFGMARELAGTGAVDLDVAAPVTLRALLAAFAARYPNVVGSVIAAGTFAPIEPNLVLLDGRRRPALDAPLQDDDKPCLLFLPSGG